MLVGASEPSYNIYTIYASHVLSKVFSHLTGKLFLRWRDKQLSLLVYYEVILDFNKVEPTLSDNLSVAREAQLTDNFNDKIKVQ